MSEMNLWMRAAGGGDVGDSAVGVHAVLAAVPDHFHLRRISSQQTPPGQ